MLSETQVELQNAQHSILFLQKEHAKTIEGLHKEIGDLQKKCSGLTFQLMLLNDSKGEDNDRGILETKNDALTKEINELKLENTELRTVLEVRDKRILLLEGQLRSKEKKYSDELKAIGKRLSELQGDADSKANTIAILTGQLHQVKRNARSGARHSVEKVKSAYSEHSNGEHPITGMSPTPPTDGTPSKARQRVYGRYAMSPTQQLSGLVVDTSTRQIVVGESPREQTLAQTVRSLPARPKLSYANAPRPAHGFSASRREKELKYFAKPKPDDYKEFLKNGERMEQQIVTKVPTEPLPPIITDMTDKYLHSDVATPSKRRQKGDLSHDTVPNSIEPAVGRFAVSTVSSPRKFMREGQSPNAS